MLRWVKNRGFWAGRGWMLALGWALLVPGWVQGAAKKPLPRLSHAEVVQLVTAEDGANFLTQVAGMVAQVRGLNVLTDAQKAALIQGSAQDLQTTAPVFNPVRQVARSKRPDAATATNLQKAQTALATAITAARKGAAANPLTPKTLKAFQQTGTAAQKLITVIRQAYKKLPASQRPAELTLAPAPGQSRVVQSGDSVSLVLHGPLGVLGSAAGAWSTSSARTDPAQQPLGNFTTDPLTGGSTAQLTLHAIATDFGGWAYVYYQDAPRRVEVLLLNLGAPADSGNGTDAGNGTDPGNGSEQYGNLVGGALTINGGFNNLVVGANLNLDNHTGLPFSGTEPTYNILVDANGTWTLNGTARFITDSNLTIDGSTPGSTGTVIVSDQAYLQTGGINIGGVGDGVLEESGGNVVLTGSGTDGGSLFVGEFSVGLAGTIFAAYSLNGGTLTVQRISSAQPLTFGSATASASGNFYFNGGVLAPSRTDATFMEGLAGAYVMSGGAIIDTSNATLEPGALGLGVNITIAQPLLNGTNGTVDGGLTKLGIGTLTLTGNNTYTGDTTVQGGTLVMAQWTGLTGNVFVLGNGTFQYTAGGDGNLTVSGNGTVDAPAGAYPWGDSTWAVTAESDGTWTIADLNCRIIAVDGGYEIAPDSNGDGLTPGGSDNSISTLSVGNLTFTGTVSEGEIENYYSGLESGGWYNVGASYELVDFGTNAGFAVSDFSLLNLGAGGWLGTFTLNPSTLQTTIITDGGTSSGNTTTDGGASAGN